MDNKVKIKTEYARINSEPVLEVQFDLSKCKLFDSCKIVCDDVESIMATIEGSIKENEIFISRYVRNVQLFLITKENPQITLNLFDKNQLIHHETFSLPSRKLEEDPKYHAPVIFTASKGMNFFDERIKHKLLGDWEAKLIFNNDGLFVKIEGKTKPILACIGTLEKEVRSSDLSFAIDADVEFLCVPSELILSRFLNQKIALHVLVKPDFQKKVKNLYYKSKISNEIKIEKTERKMRRITDFSDPLGQSFNPLKWIINYESQLPEFVQWQ